MRTVKLKGREFIEIGRGWYVKEVRNAFRVYHGPVVGENIFPTILKKYEDELGYPVDLDSPEDALEWMALKMEEQFGQQTA